MSTAAANSQPSRKTTETAGGRPRGRATLSPAKYALASTKVATVTSQSGGAIDVARAIDSSVGRNARNAATITTRISAADTANWAGLATNGLDLRLNATVDRQPSRKKTVVTTRPTRRSHGVVLRWPAIPSAMRMGVATLQTT